MVPFYEIRPGDLEIIHNHREIRFNPHLHNDIEIVYVFDKGQHMNIDGTKYEISKGQAAIIFPNILHNYYRDEWRTTNQVIIICSQQLFKGIFPNFHTITPDFPIITDVDDATSMAFSEIADCGDFDEQVAWTFLIITKLLKKIELNHADSSPLNNLPQKIISYISQNFQNDITLDSLADTFAVSKYYISHTFSSKIKTSLPQYLGQVRAEYAAELIRTTNDNINNISIKSGFSSQCTFNRIFRNVFGMTPREYKKGTSNKKQD